MAGYGVAGKDMEAHYSIQTAIEDWTESKYGILAGICYSIPFATMLLITGTVADRGNRKMMISIACMFWSACVFMMSFA